MVAASRRGRDVNAAASGGVSRWAWPIGGIAPPAAVPRLQ